MSRRFYIASICILVLSSWVCVVPAQGRTNDKVRENAQEKKTKPEQKTKSEKKTKPAEQKKSSDFLRITRDDQKRPLAMETAVIRFESPGKASNTEYVDLIGAVHVGEKDYYQRLNELFKSYDALLYELVAPEDARPAPGDSSRGMNAVSMLQRGMKSTLALEFQLDCVDYTQPNFVHADMSPEEFTKSMKDRGESFFQMFFRMMGQSMAMQGKENGNSDAQLLLALFSKDRAILLKRIMAEQFEDLEAATAALEGPNGSTIISERNKKALSVMTRERSAGKRRIGVFYGAGHLPDMQRRLLEDHGMERKETRWFTAWNLADNPSATK